MLTITKVLSVVGLAFIGISYASDTGDDFSGAGKILSREDLQSGEINILLDSRTECGAYTVIVPSSHTQHLSPVLSQAMTDNETIEVHGSQCQGSSLVAESIF